MIAHSTRFPLASATPHPVSRRAFLAGGMASLLAPTLAGCSDNPLDVGDFDGDPRLTARPAIPSLEPTIGESTLGLGNPRDGLLFVPQAYSPDTPLPLLIMLHGATGSASGLRGFGIASDDFGMAVLIPDARDATWDAVRRDFGPDVDFIDRALTHTFDRVRVDPSRVALGGFSDGASYSLSLGVPNGDLFSHLIAFSPGFMIGGRGVVGRPRVFVSHGTQDGVLPVRQSRDLIVPDLTGDGYDVHYEEFEGGHTIPGDIATQALEWFVG